MKSEKQSTQGWKKSLFSVLFILCFTVSFAQSPLERMVQDKGAIDLTLNIEEQRIQSNEFKAHVNDYVLFNFDTEIARQVRTDIPEAMELVVPTPKGDVTLQLVQETITSPDFRVETSSGAPGLDGPIGTHYRGIVKGENGSIAAASFYDGSISILGSTRLLGNFTINKLESEGDERYISYYDYDLKQQNNFECHTPDPETVPEFLQNQRLMQDLANQRGGGPCIRVHFEADYGLYNAKQQSIPNTIEYLESVFNQVTTLYTAEAINVVISYIKVWDTEDNFQGANSSETINNFQTYFLTGADLNGDLGHLASIDPGGNGGIARGIGVLCTSDDNQLAYSDMDASFQEVPNYSFTVMVVTHEMGHNLGSPHTHGCYWNGNATQIDDCGNIGQTAPEGSACYNRFNPVVPDGGGTIMSYCHLNAVGINLSDGFGPQPGDLVRIMVNGASCLSECPVFTDCVAPYQIEIENIGLNSAEVSWYHASETTFEVTVTSAFGSSTMPVNGTSITLNGLLEGTKYDVTVKTICDSPEESEGMTQDFATLCDEVYSLPYIELFEGTNWEANSYELDPCWTSVISETSYGWTVGKFETSSANTGPSGDHTTGFGKYVYGEASLGTNNDEAELITPLIDLTGADGPFATYWYHMFGATVKDLQVFVRETGEDWELLQTFSGAQQDAISDAWKQDQLLLGDYEGSVIQLKFTSTKGADFAGDIAIDDLIVSDSSLTDLAIASIFSPESGCGLGAIESASITLQNNGYQTFTAGTSVEISLSVNSGTPIVENLTLGADLEPNGTLGFTFANSLNLSNPGEYVVTVGINVAGDQVAGNNQRSKTVVSKPVIDFYPYTQSFETYTDWTTSGIESSWALGTPAKAKITGASDGTQAWVTGGLGLNQHNADEESYLEGPCFDFTNMENGVISFDVWWEIETIWDGATFQYSTDQGDSWQVLGSAADDDWFNADTITVFPGMDGWSGTDDGDNTFDGSEGWVNVSHDLSMFDGEPSVFFRVVFKSDVAVQNDGIAVDNFIIDGDFTPPACHYTTIEETTCDPNEVGSVSETFQDVDDCDSIVTTVTTLLPSYDIVVEVKVCDVDAVGTDTDAFLTTEGCDSIITTNYVLAPSYDIEVSETTCDESQVGVVTLDLTTEYGCDSIVTITTTLADPYEVTVELTTCDENEVGTETETLTATDGCDSIVTTNTTLIDPIEVTVDQTSCDPTEVGSEVTTYTAVSTGCDSVVTVNTTFEALDADFSFTVAGAQVIFSDASNFGTSYDWDFGDGNTSSSAFPTHTYEASDVYSVQLIVSEDGCESDTATQDVDVVISGIDLISFIESIQVYPNPNRGIFTVEINGANIYKDLVFTLFDVTGSEIDSRDVTFNSYAKESYALNTLANGVYFLRIQSDNQISTFKINVLK